MYYNYYNPYQIIGTPKTVPLILGNSQYNPTNSVAEMETAEGREAHASLARGYRSKVGLCEWSAAAVWGVG